MLNHESAPSVEEEENRLVATRRLQDSLLVATPSHEQLEEHDRVCAAWTSYFDDESRMAKKSDEDSHSEHDSLESLD